jgi:predicted metal-dependent hydrolase
MNFNQNIIPEHKKAYRYETGEKHKYLGCYYPLSIISTKEEPHVTLQGSNIVLYTDDSKDRKENAFILDMWYREKAREVFVPILADAVVKAAPYKKMLPKLRIYRMLDRCGSCSPKSKILILNLELIKVPKPCIEYIALHEMIHFRYPSHDMGFYAALSNLMPDWKKWEDLLNDKYPI